MGTCTAKLETVWKDCPTDHNAWVLTQDDVAALASAIRTGSRIAAYGALLPAKYRLYALPQSFRALANKDYGGIEGIECRPPFMDAQPSGQFAKPITRSTGPDRTLDHYQLFVLGFTTGDGTLTSPYAMNTPRASVTDAIFGGGDGQLGVDQETFFSRFFQPDLALHFPAKDTVTEWKNHCP